MVKKSLKILTILCTVSIYSIAQVNAMSLKDALSSSDIALDFGNSGTIVCSYIDERSEIPDPGYINTKDYLFESNTYFIQSNILDLLTNTEGGGDSSIVINSSLLGVNNISLQYLPSNNKVFDSITFTGDNSKYTGTFYLHPAIKNITFTKEESAISNISVQNTNQEQTAEQSITETNPRSLCIYLLENSYFNRLNINGNILLSFLNKHNNTIYLSFTKINNYSPYSLNVHDKVDIRINKFNYLGKKNLRSINITDGSSIEKPSTENNIKTENEGIESIQEQIDTINNNINTINTTVGEDDTKGLRSRIKTVENSIGTVKTATEGESTSIVPLQNQIDTINETTNNLSTNINDLKTAVGSVNVASNGDLQTQINTVNSSITTINTNINTSINTIKTTIGEDDTKGLRSRIKTVEDSIGTVKTATEGESTSIVPLQTQINTVNSSITTIKATIGENDSTGLRKRIKDLESIDWASKIIKLMENNNFKEKIYYILHPLVLIGKCDVKWDWNDEKTHYNYSNLKCNTCGTDANTTSVTDLDCKLPSELFSTLYCNTCKHNFTAQNISVTSYLYPENITKSDVCIELLCSVCNDDLCLNYDPYFYSIDWTQDPPLPSREEKYDQCYCNKCGATCVWDDEYIIGELTKIKDKYWDPTNNDTNEEEENEYSGENDDDV